MSTAAKRKKVEDREPERAVVDVKRDLLAAQIELALKDAEVVHANWIEDIKKQKLSEACIEEMVAKERKNWHKFYATFIAERLTTTVNAAVEGASVAAKNPGW